MSKLSETLNELDRYKRSKTNREIDNDAPEIIKFLDQLNTSFEKMTYTEKCDRLFEENKVKLFKLCCVSNIKTNSRKWIIVKTLLKSLGIDEIPEDLSRDHLRWVNSNTLATSFSDENEKWEWLFFHRDIVFKKAKDIAALEAAGQLSLPAIESLSIEELKPLPVPIDMSDEQEQLFNKFYEIFFEHLESKKTSSLFGDRECKNIARELLTNANAQELIAPCKADEKQIAELALRFACANLSINSHELDSIGRSVYKAMQKKQTISIDHLEVDFAEDEKIFIDALWPLIFSTRLLSKITSSGFITDMSESHKPIDRVSEILRIPSLVEVDLELCDINIDIFTALQLNKLLAAIKASTIKKLSLGRFSTADETKLLKIIEAVSSMSNLTSLQWSPFAHRLDSISDRLFRAYCKLLNNPNIQIFSDNRIDFDILKNGNTTYSDERVELFCQTIKSSSIEQTDFINPSFQVLPEKIRKKILDAMKDSKISSMKAELMPAATINFSQCFREICKAGTRKNMRKLDFNFWIKDLPEEDSLNLFSLVKNSKLTSFSLTDAYLWDCKKSVIDGLAAMIEASASLESLDLSNNYIGRLANDSLQPIYHPENSLNKIWAAISCSQLKHLYLRDNEIRFTSDFFHAITASKVESLHLKKNGFLNFGFHDSYLPALKNMIRKSSCRTLEMNKVGNSDNDIIKNISVLTEDIELSENLATFVFTADYESDASVTKYIPQSACQSLEINGKMHRLSDMINEWKQSPNTSEVQSYENELAQLENLVKTKSRQEIKLSRLNKINALRSKLHLLCNRVGEPKLAQLASSSSPPQPQVLGSWQQINVNYEATSASSSSSATSTNTSSNFFSSAATSNSNTHRPSGTFGEMEAKKI